MWSSFDYQLKRGVLMLFESANLALSNFILICESLYFFFEDLCANPYALLFMFQDLARFKDKHYAPSKFSFFFTFL